MPYQYDIFISYKRGDETNRWISDHFEPLLRHAVELELGRPVAIYRDNRLLDGGTWPLDLGVALGASRVLIPLLTKTYFHSEWCVRELSVVLERERQASCRTALNPNGVVVPVILHDCEILKPELTHVQCREIRECFNVRMQRESVRAEKLAEELNLAAPGIARSIENAPTWQVDWPIATADGFLNALLIKQQPQQTKVPGFTS